MIARTEMESYFEVPSSKNVILEKQLTSVSGLWRHHEKYRSKWRKDHLNVRKERLDCMLASLISVQESYVMLFVIRNRWNIILVAINLLKWGCIKLMILSQNRPYFTQKYMPSLLEYICYSFLMQWTVPRSLMRLSLIKLFDFDKVKVSWRKRSQLEL